jgi:membrane protein implicated in regulation of membrane protease activity
MSALAWLIVAIVLFAVEMLTPGIFFFACFGAGALLASLLALLGVPVWASWSAFFVVSLLSVLLVAPMVRRWAKKLPSTPVGLDSLAGQEAHVLDSIDPATGKGQVRLANGSIWLAASESLIEAGATVEIISIVGTRLQVKLKQQ